MDAAAEPMQQASPVKVAPAPPAAAAAGEGGEPAFEEPYSSGSDSEDDDSSVEGDRIGGHGEMEDGGNLVQRVAAFFFEEDSFACKIEAWVKAKAGEIDLSTHECRLTYTALFDEFQALFEAKMTDFIEAQGATVEGFYEQLARKSAADPWSNEGVFGQILVAVVEFDCFMVMMREAAEKEALARAKEAQKAALTEEKEATKQQEKKAK